MAIIQETNGLEDFVQISATSETNADGNADSVLYGITRHGEIWQWARRGNGYYGWEPVPARPERKA